MDLLIVLVILIISCVTGTLIEKVHYKKLIKREKELLYLPAVNFETEAVLERGRKVRGVKLVSSYVVVSADYFKVVSAAIKNFFGGRIGVLESVVDRARREAVVRLKEQAAGSDIILNLRLESSSLTPLAANNKQGLLKAAVIAYGTAVTYEKGKP